VAQDPSTDLDSRSAIHDVVVGFYREVVFDDLLDPVFSEDVEVDWANHIPRLIDYWCRVLLREPGFDGTVLDTHQRVHALSPLRVEHFDRWYELWARTIDARWSGPIATRAKEHAARIATTLARRLVAEEWSPELAASLDLDRTEGISA
jgi:hemoglobin